jgi:hypothetical protein
MTTIIIGLSAADQDQADNLAEMLWGQQGFGCLSVKADITQTAEAAFGITRPWLLGEADTDPLRAMDPWGATGPELFRRVERLFGEAHWGALLAKTLDLLTGHDLVVSDVTTPERASALRRAGGRLAHLGAPFLEVQPGDVVLGEGDPLVLAAELARLRPVEG